MVPSTAICAEDGTVSPATPGDLTATRGRIKVPIKYEAIMRFLAANPSASLQEGARYFGVSPGWFSTVVQSDLFVARYQEFLSELDEKLLLPQLADRVRGVAAVALERLATVVETTGSEETILRANTMLLAAAKPPASSQHVHIQGNINQVSYTLDPRLDAIQSARRLTLDAAQGPAIPCEGMGGTPIDGNAEDGVRPLPPHLQDRLVVVPQKRTIEFGPTAKPESPVPQPPGFDPVAAFGGVPADSGTPNFASPSASASSSPLRGDNNVP